jgi:hypothetical protein
MTHNERLKLLTEGHEKAQEKAPDRLEFRPVPGGLYQIWYNECNLGELYAEVDGYYVFWPDYERRGFWEGWVLQSIVIQLGILNAAWDKQVREDMDRMSGSQTEERKAIMYQRSWITRNGNECYLRAMSHPKRWYLPVGIDVRGSKAGPTGLYISVGILNRSVAITIYNGLSPHGRSM